MVVTTTVLFPPIVSLLEMSFLVTTILLFSFQNPIYREKKSRKFMSYNDIADLKKSTQQGITISIIAKVIAKRAFLLIFLIK